MSGANSELVTRDEIRGGGWVCDPTPASRPSPKILWPSDGRVLCEKRIFANIIQGFRPYSLQARNSRFGRGAALVCCGMGAGAGQGASSAKSSGEPHGC
jgi:hypothetical protein